MRINAHNDIIKIFLDLVAVSCVDDTTEERAASTLKVDVITAQKPTLQVLSISSTAPVHAINAYTGVEV